MELASKYDPKEVESKWYQYWLDNKLFASKPDGREPYTIVIPPPNVTGVLHMGHMLNNTIQDILNRVVQHVSHVEHTCHIWGRNDDGVGLTFVGFTGEKFVVKPVLIPFRFDLFWVVFACKFHIYV